MPMEKTCLVLACKSEQEELRFLLPIRFPTGKNLYKMYSTGHSSYQEKAGPKFSLQPPDRLALLILGMFVDLKCNLKCSICLRES